MSYGGGRMTRYPADITQPVRSGFYNIFCDAGHEYVGYWTGDMWIAGPMLTKQLTGPMILMRPINVYVKEWREWSDESSSPCSNRIL